MKGGGRYSSQGAMHWCGLVPLRDAQLAALLFFLSPAAYMRRCTFLLPLWRAGLAASLAG